MVERNSRTYRLGIDNKVLEEADLTGQGIQELFRMAEKAFYLEELFAKAIPLMYQLRPNGNENYTDKNSKIGEIYVWKNHDYPNNLDLLFSCSGFYNPGNRFLLLDIARIDLRKRTAKLEWKPGDRRPKKHFDIPTPLRIDTEFILPRLGLKPS